MAKKPKRKKDRLASEAALLSSAVDLFSKKGFDATTTRAIAEKAGVNEQLIQRYFGGKTGLLLAAMQGFHKSYVMNEKLLQIEGKDLADEIEKLFLAMIEICGEKGDLMRVGMCQALLNPVVGKFLSQKIREERIPEQIEKMKERQRKGWVRKDIDLYSATYGSMLIAFGLGFVGQFIHRIEKEKLKTVASYMAKVLAKGFGTD